MANEICYFTSADTGAPTLNNANGSMVDVLDACLINGYNSKSVTSIVVASNVATVTVSAHGFLGGTGKTVDIAGATPSGLNGRKKITVTGSNTFTFATSGISDQTATGTITVKRSPLGWTKLYTATGKAVYQRSDPAATTMLLRIDDTGAGVASVTNARARMVESASDIDTLTALAPTDAQLSGGQYWSKGANSSTAKSWALIGDGRTIYFCTDNTSAAGALFPNGFGDIASDKAGDAYACFLAGGYTTSDTNTFFSNPGNSFDASVVLARLSSGVGGAVGGMQITSAVTNASNTIGSSINPAYPSPVDNGMRIIPDALIREFNAAFTHPVRGVLRGIAQPLAYLPVAAGLHLTVLSSIIGSDREFLVVNLNNSSVVGALLFDITGPWA